MKLLLWIRGPRSPLVCYLGHKSTDGRPSVERDHLTVPPCFSPPCRRDSYSSQNACDERAVTNATSAAAASANHHAVAAAARPPTGAALRKG